MDIYELVKKELNKLGLTEQEAHIAVTDRRGYIHACFYNQDLNEAQIANEIWGELVYPFDEQ